MGAAAVGPDQGSTGSGVGQRLIPEEPMSIILNLGISSKSFSFIHSFRLWLVILMFVFCR